MIGTAMSSASLPHATGPAASPVHMTSPLLPDRCLSCGRQVTRDEAAATKKLMGRGTTDYYCRDCLAGMFELTTEELDRNILRWKRMGCTLFR